MSPIIHNKTLMGGVCTTCNAPMEDEDKETCPDCGSHEDETDEEEAPPEGMDFSEE